MKLTSEEIINLYKSVNCNPTPFDLIFANEYHHYLHQPYLMVGSWIITFWICIVFVDNNKSNKELFKDLFRPKSLFVLIIASPILTYLLVGMTYWPRIAKYC